MTNKLSDNERMLFNEFNAPKPRYTHWENGYKAEESGTYLSTFTKEVAEVLGKPEKSAQGVISSLIKKEYLKAAPNDGEGDDSRIELTDAGVELIHDLRIEEDEAALDLDEDHFEGDDEDEEPEIQTKSIASLAADARIKEARDKEKAGRTTAAKQDIAAGKPGMRFSHADCDHPIHGKEGKQARAKCRRERAAKLAAELAEANK